jgi:hypothetical protein
VEEEGTIRFNSTSKCFEGYDGSEWVPFNRKYKVGDLAHGGIVFYIDESGEHGYVCSETDFPAGANWAPGGFLNYLHIGGGGLGGGSFLTETIVREYGLLGSSSNNYAAALCRNLIENGYSDWYLPNLDEATLMWNNLADSDQDGINSGPGDPNNLGNFEAAQYWTAQELGPSNPENAIGKSFADNSIIILSKFSFLSVRAIRKF